MEASTSNGDDGEQRTETTVTRIKGTLQGPLKASIKLTRIATRAEHHVEKLTQSINQDFPPRGLTPKITPNIPDTPISFIIQWSAAQHNLGVQLTTLLKDYWAKKGSDARAELRDNNSNLQQQSTPEEWTTIQRILETVETDTKQQLRRRRPRPPPPDYQANQPPTQRRREVATAGSRGTQQTPQ